MNQFQTPVAYVVYNRPQHVMRTFEAIRLLKPQILFLIADGPKPDSFTDNERCQLVRNILENIDWPCKVYRNYSESNLGLKKRISTGLDWVFSLADRAIVLEDDCLAHHDFFRFCSDLLEWYKSDERIWCITGDNFQKGNIRGTGSYYFSKYPHCWGWATWANRWVKNDSNISFWKTFKASKKWEILNAGEIEQSYWEKIFAQVEQGVVNSWAYPWTASVWAYGGLTATPNVNLVSNIGFDEHGTNCREASSNPSTDATSLGKQLLHPLEIIRDVGADVFTFDNHFNSTHLPSSQQNNREVQSRLRFADNLKKLISIQKKGVENIENESSSFLNIDDAGLISLPRYSETTVLLEGKPFLIPDSVSCYYAHREIFKNEIYKFHSDNPKPRIVDCGANIGLSVLYFKKLYPNAIITAVEADYRIFSYLARNIGFLGNEAVSILPKAVSSSRGEVLFRHEGADAGREVKSEYEYADVSSVPSIHLDDLLEDPVDFLKMDIEGAELEALLGCSRLGNVKNLFVEYHSFSNQQQKLHDLLQLLSQTGFRYYVSTVFSPRHPFVIQETQLGMDLQLNISCVRMSTA